jgi:crossover junction endodeoxyribonuclease RuvC
LSILKVKDFSDAKLDATDALGAAVCHFYQGSAVAGVTKGIGRAKKTSSWESFIKSNPDRVKGE